jgi:hypothetical protein
MDIGSFLIADAKSAKLIEPSERPRTPAVSQTYLSSEWLVFKIGVLGRKRECSEFCNQCCRGKGLDGAGFWGTRE